MCSYYPDTVPACFKSGFVLDNLKSITDVLIVGINRFYIFWVAFEQGKFHYA